MGNKCDLQDGRKVEMSAVQDYADSIDSLFFETSALKNTGTKYLGMSRDARKAVFGFPTRSDTNRPVQLQEMAGSLKFRI